MQFATGDGRAAGHIGAVLLLGAAPGFSVAEARRVLGQRIRAAAASYAGTLRITILSDPSHMPDAPALAAALRHELSGVPEATGAHRTGWPGPSALAGRPGPFSA
jgi:hypothetical protein